MAATQVRRASEREAAGDDVQTVRLSIPAKPEFLALARLALAGLARVRPLPDELLSDLKLAITEATSNSVRHAYAGEGGRVEVLYELRAGSLAIEVSDDGVGFEPSERRAEGGELTEGGLGIAIIRAIADELEIGVGERGRGSRLRFVKRLPSLSAA